MTLQHILDEFQIPGNEEQERAVQIVAEHYIKKDPKQLLMYIAGVGGTGKSHVIKAIAEFFVRLDEPEKLLLSAPTGIAAVLIKGYTVHALTFLPKS
ncbi:hypothetical protein BV25DRAFT_1799457, partial [Artomyces pyxidatus]